MRVLLYGLQGSGGCQVAYYLAQGGFLSIGQLNWVDLIPPLVGVDNIVVNIHLSTAFPLQQHVDTFKPDKKYLVVRNPVEDYLHLREGSLNGPLKSQFFLLEEIWKHRERLFDGVIRYERFLMGTIWPLDRDLGAKHEWFEYPLDGKRVTERTRLALAGQKLNNKSWGTGTVRNDRFPASGELRRLAPELFREYEG